MQGRLADLAQALRSRQLLADGLEGVHVEAVVKLETPGVEDRAEDHGVVFRQRAHRPDSIRRAEEAPAH